MNGRAAALAFAREIEHFPMFARAGLTEVALRLHDDPMEALDLIGQHVLPQLR